MPFPSQQDALRRAVAGGVRRILAAVERRDPRAPQPPIGEVARRQPGTFSHEDGSATAILVDRLTPEDVATARDRIAADADLAALYEGAMPVDQRRLLLSLGVFLGVDGVAEHARLPTAQPPEEVHAMARGPLAAAGGLYEADLVLDALASAGVDPATVTAGLDFGCSSGRVLRVLASTLPDVAWHGCDPNDPAIAWAQRVLPGVNLFQSGDAPPLPLDDASLDLVYAISIWSHFAPDLGLRWFEEMHRILRPGGHLVMTTHGTTTVEYDLAHGTRGASQAAEIREALIATGAWYRAEFGDAGDWGVTNPEWGTAFLTPEWVLSRLTPQWHLLEYVPGRNADNQDVYVLRRA